MKYVPKEIRDYRYDLLDPRHYLAIHSSGSVTSTPPLNPFLQTVGGASLSYSGLLSEDVDQAAKYGYTFFRVGLNVIFYIGAAAVFTIADQLLALIPDEIY